MRKERKKTEWDSRDRGWDKATVVGGARGRGEIQVVHGIQEIKEGNGLLEGYGREKNGILRLKICGT